MKKLKRFWFDLTNPRDWSIYISTIHLLWKIKDYERLENDYCEVLCYATGYKMSKSNYLVEECKSQIDMYQEHFYNETTKDDLTMIMGEGGTIDDVRKYVNDL